MNRTKGSITIFLCLVITVIMSLVCTVVESARVHAARSYARSLTYMAMEYQFANYARQVFEDYGLLTIWEQGNIKEEIKNYINRSNNKVDLSDGALDMSQLTVSNLDNSQFERVTDNGGDAMVNQILDYEKYEISGVLVTEFLNVLQSQDAIDEDFSLAQEYLNSNASEEFDNAKTDENQQMVLDLEEAFLEIKDADISGWKLDFDETDNKVKKTFKNLKNSLEELQEFIDELNPKILEYENLGKSTVNGEYSSEDWIAQNINYVKNIDEKNESTLEYLEQAITGMDNNITEEEKVKIVDNISQNLSDMCIYQEQLATTEATTDDEQSKNLFETAKKLIDSGVLELVMPEGMETSTACVNKGKLPSANPSVAKVNPLGEPVNKAMYIYYLYNNFGSAVSKNMDGALLYELEYILMGNDSDKSNLASTVEALLLIRQTFNTVSLLNDPQKMALCSTVATAASVAICLPFLQPLIKTILIQAWCLVESVYDVRCLLSGEEVVLFKDTTNWKTSIYNLAIPEEVKGDVTKDGIKMDYETYLCILLFTKSNQDIIYRTMDLIEANVSKNYNPGFKLKNCVVAADVKIDYISEEVFLSVPILDKGYGTGGYMISTECFYGY